MKSKTVFTFTNNKPAISVIIETIEELDLSDIPMTTGIPKELIKIYMYIVLQGSLNFINAKNLVNNVLKNTNSSNNDILNLERSVVDIMKSASPTIPKDAYNMFICLEMDKLISVGSRFFNTLYYYFKCITIRYHLIPKEVEITIPEILYTTLDDMDASNHANEYAGVTAFSLQVCPIDLFLVNTVIINDTLPPIIIESKEDIVRTIKTHIYKYMEINKIVYLDSNVKIIMPRFQLRKDTDETH